MNQILRLSAPQEEGPWLIFGGPYSNFQATEALYFECKGLGIPANRVICTGDVVAYCAQPSETVDLLRQWGCHVLMGNCEESLAAGAEDCGCGFEEGTACAVLSDQWFRFSMAHVSSDQCVWMGSLPREISLQWGSFRIKVVHGSGDSINQFVFESEPDSFFEEQLTGLQADVVLAGHSGLPFTRRVETGVWHNAGVIGMPANDGTPRTWYSLMHWGQQGPEFEHRSLEYDSGSAALVMRERGLDNGYARALTTGLWPSLDVLPQTERQQTGRALTL